MRNIDSIGSIWCRNSLISNFNGLSSIKYISEFIFTDNSLLNGISALSNVSTTNTFQIIIHNNPNLNSLNGIQNFNVTGEVSIKSNNLLTSLDGLNPNLDSLWMLSIYDNNQLK